MEEITKAEAEKMLFMFLGREVRIREKTEENRIRYPARYMRKSELLKLKNGEHLSECERGHADPCTGRNKPYCISRKYFYNRSPGKRREPHHQKSCVGGDES